MGLTRIARILSRGGLAGLLILIVSSATSFLLATPAPALDSSTGLAAGISTGNIDSLSNGALQATMQGIAAAGATWVRVDAYWPVVEASPGSYSWSVPDRVIRAALSNDLQVDVVLDYTPQWAADPATGYPDPTYFAQFASAAASHYSAMGVDAFEIYNEPNISSSWAYEASPTQTRTVSPSAYTALLIDAYDAIKAVDPAGFVITGGLAPAATAPDGSSMAPQDFLADMYADGAHGHFDAVGVHPYSYPADPTDSTTSTWNFFYNLPDWIYQLMVTNGDGDKKVWMTEFGAPTGTDTSGGAVTEQAQAQMITDAFNQASKWPWAGPLFVYNWQDGGDPTNIDDNFGLLDSSGNPKPSLAAFESAAQSLRSISVGASSSGTTGRAVDNPTASCETGCVPSPSVPTIAVQPSSAQAQPAAAPAASTSAAPVPAASGAAVAANSGFLAFTGSGKGLVWVALAGFVLIVFGLGARAYGVVHRPRRRAGPTRHEWPLWIE